MAVPVVVAAAQRALATVSDPAVRAKALELARKGARALVPQDEPAIARYVSSGPAPAAVVLGGFARAGVNPEQFFENVALAEADQRTRAVLDGLRAQYRETQRVLDSKAQLGAVDTLSERLQMQAVIAWAAKRFGANKKAIMEAHALLRIFIETDSATLEAELIANRAMLTG